MNWNSYSNKFRINSMFSVYFYMIRRFLTKLLWKVINKCTSYPSYPSYCNNHWIGAHAFISLKVDLATSGYSMYIDPYDLIHTCSVKFIILLFLFIGNPHMVFVRMYPSTLSVKIKNDSCLFFVLKWKKKMFLTQYFRKYGNYEEKLAILLLPLPPRCLPPYAFLVAYSSKVMSLDAWKDLIYLKFSSSKVSFAMQSFEFLLH